MNVKHNEESDDELNDLKNKLINYNALEKQYQISQQQLKEALNREATLNANHQKELANSNQNCAEVNRELVSSKVQDEVEAFKKQTQQTFKKQLADERKKILDQATQDLNNKQSQIGSKYQNELSKLQNNLQTVHQTQIQILEKKLQDLESSYRKQLEENALKNKLELVEVKKLAEEAKQQYLNEQKEVESQYRENIEKMKTDGQAELATLQQELMNAKVDQASVQQIVNNAKTKLTDKINQILEGETE